MIIIRSTPAYDGVIILNCFRYYWSLVVEIHWPPMYSTQKGQWCEDLMYPLSFTWKRLLIKLSSCLWFEISCHPNESMVILQVINDRNRFVMVVTYAMCNLREVYIHIHIYIYRYKRENSVTKIHLKTGSDAYLEPGVPLIRTPPPISLTHKLVAESLWHFAQYTVMWLPRSAILRVD